MHTVFSICFVLVSIEAARRYRRCCIRNKTSRAPPTVLYGTGEKKEEFPHENGTKISLFMIKTIVIGFWLILES